MKQAIGLMMAMLCLNRSVLATERTVAAEALRAEASRVQPFSCSSAPLVSCPSSLNASPSCLSDQYFVDLYTFVATAGQTVTVSATTATGYQILLTIQSSSGPIITSKFGVSPVSLTYTFATGGTYFFGIGYVAQFATGLYTLSVTCGSGNTTCQSSGTIGMNSSISGQLTSSNGTACLGGTTYSAVYGFNGTRDVPVMITFSSSFAPYVEVAPASNDGGVWKQGNTAGAISLVFLPPVTGNNWMYLSSNTNSAVTGTYVIKIEPAPLDACKRHSVSH